MDAAPEGDAELMVAPGCTPTKSAARIIPPMPVPGLLAANAVRSMPCSAANLRANGDAKTRCPGAVGRVAGAGTAAGTGGGVAAAGLGEAGGGAGVAGTAAWGASLGFAAGVCK